MPSDDDRSEVLDDDFLTAEYPPERRDEPPWLDERDRPVLLLDETDDAAEPSDLDEGETGSSVLGETGEADWSGDDNGPRLGPPSSPLAADRVPLPAEEDAVHLVREDDRRS